MSGRCNPQHCCCLCCRPQDSPKVKVDRSQCTCTCGPCCSARYKLRKKNDPLTIRQRELKTLPGTDSYKLFPNGVTLPTCYDTLPVASSKKRKSAPVAGGLTRGQSAEDQFTEDDDKENESSRVQNKEQLPSHLKLSESKLPRVDPASSKGKFCLLRVIYEEIGAMILMVGYVSRWWAMVGDGGL